MQFVMLQSLRSGQDYESNSHYPSLLNPKLHDKRECCITLPKMSQLTLLSNPQSSFKELLASSHLMQIRRCPDCFWSFNSLGKAS